MILDGWGIGADTKSNAIYSAHPAYWNHLIETYPHSQLQASGENVGLPDGQMGNSEVGHLNIGAGRVVYQDLGTPRPGASPYKGLTAGRTGPPAFCPWL